MIPDERLSSRPITAPYLYPDDLEADSLTDYEMGGVAFNDPSKGFQYQKWKFEVLEGTNIVVASTNSGISETVLQPTGTLITEMSGSFNGNMQPVVAYVQNGNGFIYYYDGDIPGYTTLGIGPVSGLRLTADDKRRLPVILNSVDVLLFYIRDHKLWYRQQREDYSVERLLHPNVGNRDRISYLGMNEKNRVQIKVSKRSV